MNYKTIALELFNAITVKDFSLFYSIAKELKGIDLEITQQELIKLQGVTQ